MAKNPKMVICRKCNTAFADNAKRCPACQAKNKKPFYKKWWFILLVIIVVLCGMGSCRKDNNEDYEKYTWAEIELSGKLPKPESNTANILWNSEENLSMYVPNISKAMYKSYVIACEDAGYTFESNKWEQGYSAYNSEGYKLDLMYTEGVEDLHIGLVAPEKMNGFVWPTAGVGSMLPIPTSQVGDVLKDSSDCYSVKVGNMTLDNYTEYVKSCEEIGFTVDYERDEKSYTALNAEGYKLNLEYTGFNTVKITIEAPKPEKAEEESKASVKSGREQESEALKETSDKADEQEEASESASDLVDGMRPEFKEAMDSYEAFYEEYCAVLKKYNNNPTDLTILAEYTKLMQKATDMDEKFAQWDDGELNDAELKYYLEVNSRVTQMMLDVY